MKKVAVFGNTGGGKSTLSQRLAKITGLPWVPPAGWPENSPLLRGTLKSYYTVWLCHTKLTPYYRQYVERAKATKQVYHLRSRQDIEQFWQTISTEFKT